MIAQNGEGEPSRDAAAWTRSPAAPAASAPVRRSAKGAILLIDPNRFSRERFEMLLSAETPDFEVIGAAALESAPAGALARATIVVVNALDGAGAAAIVSRAASKPVLWLCEQCDGDFDDDDFHMFPASGSPALLAAALQLIAAGGRFSTQRRIARPDAAPRAMARSPTETRQHVPAPA